MHDMQEAGCTIGVGGGRTESRTSQAGREREGKNTQADRKTLSIIP